MQHQAYRVLCERYGMPVLASPHFTRALVVRFVLEAVRHKVQGVVTRRIQGIRLKRASNEAECMVDRTMG
ncbi:MAG: hypothetical protein IT324_06060 [Anaerolineae bacterium]|nr:hypothetical protein [Anaerolineae bacterium]